MGRNLKVKSVTVAGYVWIYYKLVPIIPYICVRVDVEVTSEVGQLKSPASGSA